MVILAGCNEQPADIPTPTPVPVTQAVPTTTSVPTGTTVTPTLMPTLTPTNTPTPSLEDVLTDREIIALNELFGNEDGVYGYFTKTEDEIVRIPDLLLDTLVDGYSRFASSPNICLYMFRKNKDEYTERYEFDMDKETGYYLTVDYLAKDGLTVKAVRDKSVKFYDSDLNEIEFIDGFYTITYDYTKRIFKNFCKSIEGNYAYEFTGVPSDGGQFFWFNTGSAEWQIKYEIKDAVHKLSIYMLDGEDSRYYRFEWSENDILTGNELALLKE